MKQFIDQILSIKKLIKKLFKSLIIMIINMWGNKTFEVKKSEFLKGVTIFEKLNKSMFGKIRETFSELFSVDDAKEYILPKVIMIGTESTGKSSLLENITKCQLFPRDSKLCTKMPIHVKLNNGPGNYEISLYDQTQDEYFVERVRNKNEIYDIVKLYMNKLPEDFISDKEITISITDNDMPDFEFYDLPGIRTYPPETATISTNLCKKYLQDKNSIILCVVPATTTRLTACQSIALISQMGRENDCIIALTMADRLQPENIEDLLIKRIIGTSDELKNLNFAGCVAIVNRRHCDKFSLNENDVNESKWFNNNIIKYVPQHYKEYVEQIKQNITIVNLVTEMDKLYNQFMDKNWKPKILKSIQDKLQLLDKTYDDIGTEFNESNLNAWYSAWLQDRKSSLPHNYYNNPSDFTSFYAVTKIGTNANGNNINIYHLNCKKINEMLENYSKLSIDSLIGILHDSIKNDYVSKIYRFDKTNNDLCSRLKNTFETLVESNKKMVADKVKEIYLNDYLQNVEKSDTHYFNLIYRMYHLFVFDQLFKIEINYTTCDYIENDDIILKREQVKESIAKAKLHYDKICALKITH
jgi:GTP-binding protein EngB required for normal cell division